MTLPDVGVWVCVDCEIVADHHLAFSGELAAPCPYCGSSLTAARYAAVADAEPLVTVPVELGDKADFVYVEARRIIQ